MPCPFCGGEAKPERQHGDIGSTWAVICVGNKKCPCYCHRPYADVDKATAIQMWNSRHAARTAEGIPQADGWVAIEIGGLPGIGGEYIVAYTPSDGEFPPIIETVAEFCSKSRGIREKYEAGKWYYVGSRALEFTGVVAWQEIPTYQRQSREGGGCG